MKRVKIIVMAFLLMSLCACSSVKMEVINGNPEDNVASSVSADDARESVVTRRAPLSFSNYEDFSNAQTGDTIIWGRYEQDNYPENGREAIEWIVLSKKNDELFVVSKYVLDQREYNEVAASVTWETCTLREWLNNDFYNDSFNASEKSCIKSVRLKNRDNPSDSMQKIKGGNDTEDKVFLLSYEDVTNKEYGFCEEPDDKKEDNMISRRCAASEGAYGVYTDYDYSTTEGKGSCYWWLRTPGKEAYKAIKVCPNGKISVAGSFVGRLSTEVISYNQSAGWALVTSSSTEYDMDRIDEAHACTRIGVRPALVIDLQMTESMQEEKKPDFQSVKVGDYITFGTYEQRIYEQGAEPIEWKVLSSKNGELLLISKYVLDCQSYNTDQTSVTWETSSLREWLNNDFYNTAFNDDEKNRILDNELINNDNKKNRTVDGGNPTIDKVFILSEDEANNHLSMDERTCQTTEYGETVHVPEYAVKGGMWGCCWWLRNPGKGADYATYMHSDGRCLYDYSVDKLAGIRPVIKISIQ